MRRGTAWLVREVHFVSALCLGLVLLFYGTTGFMAEHREWFHPRVSRDDLSDAHAFADGETCTPSGLTAAVRAAGHVPGTMRTPDGWLWLDTDDGATACEAGQAVWFEGHAEPVPADLPARGTGQTAWIERYLGDRREKPGALDGLADTVARSVDTFGITTVTLQEGSPTWVRWERRFPVAYALIGVHKGGGGSNRLLPVTVSLVIVTVVTGILHGMRFRGKRRRFVVAMLVSTALVAWLLLG
ncbi:MAG: hypothetical protein H6733_04560 [Alphaproteobacteria bacterium]|nr:hypothetical protein [Alphaproteobacteria bacterium]